MEDLEKVLCLEKNLRTEGVWSCFPFSEMNSEFKGEQEKMRQSKTDAEN